MTLTPQSWGSFTEANDCHVPAGSPAGGQFAVKGQGRCLGVAARVDARRRMGPIPRMGGEFGEILGARKDARRLARLQVIPTYLQKDLKTARRTDGALAYWNFPGSGHAAALNPRLIKIGNEGRRAQILTGVRHEIGHIDRTPLGRGGHKIGGLEVGATFQEEVRAWKNAIRNSGGRVKMSQIEWALGSYLARDKSLIPSMEGRQFEDYASLEFEARKVGRAMVAKHIMPVLRRYARKIRRAAKGLPR